MKIKTYIVSFLALISFSLIAQQTYDFRGHQFDTIANFKNTQFRIPALFGGAQFDSAALFNSAKFKSNASFKKTQFKSVAIFNCVEFKLTAHFEKTQFNLPAIFDRTEFKSNAYFKKAQFKSVAIFDRAHFYNSNTDFTNVQFVSPVRFHRTKYFSFACFNSAEFRSSAYFGATRFDSIAYFRYAAFYDVANFEYAKFHVLADFVETKFDSIAIFHFAHFYNNTSFNRAILPYILDFSDIIIDNEEIDLTVAKINPEYGVCKINLVNSNIDKVLFKYSRFELYFHDSTDIESKVTVYEKLLLKQKKEGFVLSYEKLDKEYKEFNYKELWYRKFWLTREVKYLKYIGYLLNWINKYWWGYGYDKILIIFNAIIFFLIISFFNSFVWYRNKRKIIYRIPKLHKLRNEIENQKKLIKWFKCFLLACFYTATIFFGLKFEIKNLQYSKPLKNKMIRLIGFFALYLLGLIFVGYLLNFILSN